MSKIFISYAREDARIARRLYEDLRDLGADLWLDSQDLMPGQDWELEIRRALRASSHVLVLLSEFSVGKRGFVQKEVRQALDVLEELRPGDVFVIPVRLDTSQPAHERLARLQWVDLFESYRAGVTKLAQALGLRRNDSEASAPEPLAVPPSTLEPAQVTFSSRAQADCRRWGYAEEDIVKFLVHEFARHSVAYRQAFSSLPLVYRGHVLVLSWDLSHLEIESVVTRGEVSPTLPAWSDLLVAYRRALGLPYRTGSVESLLLRTEARRTLLALQKVVRAADVFLRTEASTESGDLTGRLALQPLLEEVEDALLAADLAVAVPRLEMILSSVHKLLLEHTPGSQWASSAALPQEDRDKEDGGQVRVLLVDDEAAVRHLVSELLRRQGFYVRAVGAGTEALPLLVDREFNVVVTDVEMPGIDGIEIARIARQLPGTKVVLISGYNDVELVRRAIRFGQFLEKPFTIEQIVGAVEAASPWRVPGPETGEQADGSVLGEPK